MICYIIRTIYAYIFKSSTIQTQENTTTITENNSLKTQITSLQSENTSLKTQTTSLQSENTSLKTRNTQLQSDNSTALNQITSLHAENTILQKQIDFFNASDVTLETVLSSYKNFNDFMGELISGEKYFIEIVSGGPDFTFDDKPLAGFVYNNKFYFKALFLTGEHVIKNNNNTYNVSYVRPEIQQVIAKTTEQNTTIFLKGNYFGNDPSIYNVLIADNNIPDIPLQYTVANYTDTEIVIVVNNILHNTTFRVQIAAKYDRIHISNIMLFDVTPPTISSDM